MTRLQQTFTVATIVAVASIVVATASLTARADRAPAGESSAPRYDVSSVDVASFAIFRDPQEADVMPAGVRNVLSSLVETDGVDLNRARAVAVIGVDAVWAIPGDDTICLAIPDPVDGFGVNCKSPKEAAAGKLFAPLVGGADQKIGDVRVAMFVPDGVEAVTAVAQDGTRRVLDVANNVAVADLANSGTIEFTNSTGASFVTAVPGTPQELAAN